MEVKIVQKKIKLSDLLKTGSEVVDLAEKFLEKFNKFKQDLCTLTEKENNINKKKEQTK